MKVFELLDINKFINEVKARKVVTARTFKKNDKNEMIPNEGSFYDPSIFGFTSKEKFDKYAYIQLEKSVLHPFIFKNLKKIGSDFNKCINKKENYIISEGMLKKDKSGGNSVAFIINNWNKLDFSKYKHEKNKLFISIIESTKKEILIINKIPVIPIGYRNYTINHGMIEEDEITALYKKVLNLSESKEWTQSFSDEQKTSFDKVIQNIYKETSKKEYLQNYVLTLYNYFMDSLSGKDGLFNAVLASKRIDNVARFVINAQIDIPIDTVAVPWQGLITLFDLFVITFLQKPENEKIAKQLGVLDKSPDEISALMEYIYKNVEIYIKHNPENEKLWIEILTQIFNTNPDLRVLAKRDPGWSETSFWCLKPIILTGINYVLLLPSFVYAPIGGDSFYSAKIFQNVGEPNKSFLYKDDDVLISSENYSRNKFITSEQFYTFKNENSQKISSELNWEDYIIKTGLKKIF